MGGDRRSPPRRRLKGGGGVKPRKAGGDSSNGGGQFVSARTGSGIGSKKVFSVLQKGLNSFQDNGNSISVEEIDNQEILEQDLSGSEKSLDGNLDKFRGNESVGQDSVGIAGLSNDVLDCGTYNHEGTDFVVGNSTKNFGDANSSCSRPVVGEVIASYSECMETDMVATEVLKDLKGKYDGNNGSSSNNYKKSAVDVHTANHQLEDISGVLVSVSKNDFSKPDAISASSDLQVFPMEGSTNCLQDDKNIESRMQLEDGQIPDFTFNILNPMFVMEVDKDNINNLGSCLKEGEELFVTENLNSVKICNPNDAKNLDRREWSDGICQNANCNASTSNGEFLQSAKTELGRKPSGLSTSQNNAHNAWKKPIHVPVDWQNKGKASDDGKFVKLNLDAISSNQSKLKKALVGKLIGKKLPFNILAAEIRKRWEPYGEFRFILTGEDCFTCIFNSTEARDAVLMGGPWLIGGHIVGLDKWSSNYAHGSLNGLTSPVWIRLPKLPLLYWDDDNIARIASMVGHPLWIDAYTSGQARCAYARVCVRLDLAQKLPKGVWIPGINGNFFQHVEYEGIHSGCLNCGCIGHKTANCGGEIVRRGTDGGISSNTLKTTSAVGGKGRMQDTFYSPRKGEEMVSGVPKEDHPIGFTSRGDCSNTGMVFSGLLPTEGIPSAITVRGDCSNKGVAFSDKKAGTNSVSCIEEDDDNGPWFFVARRKDRFNTRGRKSGHNPIVSIDRLQQNTKEDYSRVQDQNGNLKHNHDNFADIPTINGKASTECKGKEIAVDDCSSLRGKESHLPAVVFSATTMGGSLVIGEGKSSSFKLRNYKERGSNRVPSAKEISKLGPIATGSRKRRKEASDCGDLMDLKDFCDKELDGAVMVIQESISECGGDASPLVK